MGSGTVAMVGVNMVELAMVKFAMVGTECVPPTTPCQGNNRRSSGQNIVMRANISWHGICPCCWEGRRYPVDCMSYASGASSMDGAKQRIEVKLHKRRQGL